MSKYSGSLCLLVLAVSGQLCAQIPSRTDTTSTPVPNAGHDFIHAPVETVNPANGSLSIRIGVPMPASRGFSLPFNFAYDSNGISYIASMDGSAGLSWATSRARLSQGGWSYSGPMMSVQKALYTGYDDRGNPVTCPSLTGYVFQDAAGNRHNLGLSYYGGPAACLINGAPDGATTSGGEGPIIATTTSDWHNGYVNPVTVTDGDGTVYSFSSISPQPSAGNCLGTCYPTTWLPSSITDRNGNTLSVNSLTTGNPILSYTDTVGRTALNIPSFGASPDSVTVSGLGAAYQVYWTSVTPTYSVSLTDAGSTQPCASPGGSHASMAAVSSIVLPNGTQFSFLYDSAYGVVNKVTYPTGGYVRYDWGMNPQSEYGHWPSTTSQDPNGHCDYRYDAPAILHRYVSFDGTNEVLQQDFSYSTNWSTSSQWQTKQTTVTTHDLVRGPTYTYTTVYTYSSVDADQPPNTGGGQAPQIPVESKIQYYADTNTNGTPLRTVDKLWAGERALTQQKVTLDNGLVSETDWSYDINEQVTEQDDYDYGSGARGGLLRATKTTYAPFTPHIVDRPSSVAVYDVIPGPTTQPLAYTGYTYDGDGTCCGNLTTKTQRLNQSGSSTLQTQYTYNSHGAPITMTDPAGKITNYDYTDDFYDTCSLTTTNAYLTKITYPTTNGVSHVESFKYFCASGNLASSTDQNAQVTSYKYADSFDRLTEVDYPSPFGKSTITYNDTPSVSVETKRQIDATRSTDTIDLYDGLFHPVAHSVANGEASNPWDRSDTCYDGDGRVRFTSYPYQTGSSSAAPNCSGVGDSIVYDSLGRAKAVTHSDNSVVTTTYTGRATDVKDEGNNTRSVERISQVDGLGRLQNVCEVTNQPQEGVSPAACGLDYSGKGFLTGYGYTVRGDLSSVSQGVISRSFQYDLASRLTSATNPESGAITYSYDSDTNCPAQQSYSGELISRTDARGVRTCMQYDELHRVTGKTYSDSTPAVTYNYDETSSHGITLTNTKGRRSSESTGGTYPTAEIFSYDAMGHIIDNSQCTPQNCPSGNSVFPVTYPAYDDLGNVLSAVNRSDVTFGYAYNVAGRLTSVTSSLTGTNHPGTLISSLSYNAFGSPRSSALGNGFGESMSYTPRGWLSSYSVQSPNATQASGTITINGSEQSHLTGSPTPGTGWVTITGSEDSGVFCDDNGRNCRTKYNAGNVAIVVNGITTSVLYGQTSTPESIASDLVWHINGGSAGAYVTASASGATVYLTSTTSGSGTNYSLSTWSTTNDPADFGFASFDGNPSGANLTGGSDGVLVYDSGSVSVSINNGASISSPYGQGSSNSSIASDLASRISTNSPFVNATASGNTIYLTSKTAGGTTNYPFTTSVSGSFTPPSFSTSPGSGALSGGTGGVAYSLGMGYASDGDPISANDSVNSTWTYSYDDFNRLNTATATNGSGCSEVYDRYGNRWQQNSNSGSCNSSQFSFTGNNTTNNNRIDGYGYDAAGNVTNDGTHTYTYDAENRIATVSGGGTMASYVYNAAGQRVSKTSNGVTVDYLYDLSGHVISELSASGVWNRGEIYAGGRHLATYTGGANGTTYFNHSDWLGTERARTTPAGAVYSTWTSLPFGEGSSTPNPGPTHFTGKERDQEDNLDYFGARYYTSAMGRFMQPDPLFATPLHVVNPQRWNMYSYVVNNPTNYVDPDGRDAIAVNFVSEVPVGGHQGIVAVHSNGSATYARFGPNPPGSAAGRGEVVKQALQTSVQFQSNGLPTDASYKALAQEVATVEKQPVSTVGFNYFKTSEAETTALQDWMDQMKAASDRGQAPDYQVNTQNCATFCIAGLLRANAIENKGLSIIPDRLFMILAARAAESWTWQGRKPNPEPNATRHDNVHCLKNRDGTCVP